MVANIDMTNGRANIAFLGSRKDIWHRMGQEMKEGQTIEQWAVQAGLSWNAVKVPAVAMLDGSTFDHLDAGTRFRKIEGRSFSVRSDTGGFLGFVSGEGEEDGYKFVQPRGLLEWFDKYISVDDRFALDVAGSLDGGRKIWATARYNGNISVAGEDHAARVLMSTSFDGTQSTVNQCTMTRVVCQNTLRLAHSDSRAMVKTRHSTYFNAESVGRELSQLAKGFETFKAIGDAMGQHHMAKDEVADFFKDLLEIPRHASKDDVSTRKLNQYSDLAAAYKTSVQEGAAQDTPWAALQAVTRYCDHSRSVKAGDGSKDEARFESSMFGSGDILKGKAMNMLLPLVRDKVAA